MWALLFPQFAVHNSLVYPLQAFGRGTIKYSSVKLKRTGNLK
jgi:hypothetical protein